MHIDISQLECDVRRVFDRLDRLENQEQRPLKDSTVKKHVKYLRFGLEQLRQYCLSGGIDVELFYSTLLTNPVEFNRTVWQSSNVVEFLLARREAFINLCGIVKNYPPVGSAIKHLIAKEREAGKELNAHECVVFLMNYIDDLVSRAARRT